MPSNFAKSVSQSTCNSLVAIEWIFITFVGFDVLTHVVK
jgi:hypothetical protein